MAICMDNYNVFYFIKKQEKVMRKILSMKLKK